MHNARNPRSAGRRIAVALLLFAALPSVAAAAGSRLQLDYPATRRVDHADSYHGVTIADPYRWLEDGSSDEVVAWSRAQDRVARGLVEDLPLRDEILARIEEVAPREISSTPHVRDTGVFYQKSFRNDAGDMVDQIVVIPTAGDEQRMLFDTRSEAPETRLATYSGSGSASFRPSPDGRYVAFGHAPYPERWTSWRIYDLAAGRLLDERIVGINTSVFTTVWWAPDGNGFYYAGFDPPTDGSRGEPRKLLDQRVLFHRLGTQQAEDRLVYAAPDRPEMTFTVTPTADGGAVVVDGGGRADGRTVLVPVDAEGGGEAVLLAQGELDFRVVHGDADHLWALTRIGAERGRLVRIDRSRPQPEHWRDVIAEDPVATIFDVELYGGRILVHYVRDALPEVKIFGLDGALRTAVALPYVGWLSSGFEGRFDQPVASFDIQGTIDYRSAYFLDLDTGETELFRSSTPDLDMTRYITEQVFYPSQDGTTVPMYLIYPRGLERDGGNPVWLYAYGSNWSAAPWYQVQHRIWLEMGGVYALANVRGGGEYGQAWIDAGAGINKQTGIDDYIAAGQWLIQEGFTSRELLVANGGSASGPLAGAALVQRPELFGAAIIDYPVLDMLRYEALSTAIGANFGTVEDPAEFAALRAWSPLHNIAPDTCYPPTLVAHGDEDQLAPPAHSFKFVAALQAAQACDRPIALQIAWGRGHTVGGTEERANQMAFLARTLGLSGLRSTGGAAGGDGARPGSIRGR